MVSKMTDTPTPKNPESSAEVVDLDKARAVKEAKDEKSKKDPPVETFWTQELMRRGDYAVTVDQTRKVILMRWNRQRRIWEDAAEADLEADVTKFLTINKPKLYSLAAVKKCTQITESHIYTYGKRLVRDKKFLISTENHFLEVVEGKILAWSKDEMGADCKKLYPRVHVEVDLSGTGRIGKYYVPQKNEQIERKESYVSLFIRQSFKKIDNRRCAQEFMGDTLNPVIRKAFPVLIGKPDGGKSMVLDILKGMHLRSTSIDLEGLDDFDTEKLMGCSFVAIDELGKTFKERKFKQLFGGAGFSIKRKHVSNLTVDIDFKTMGADNFEFTYSEKSGALERRFFFIHVDDVPIDLQKTGLRDLILNSEEEKIDMLDWMLNGALEVVNRGRILRHEELPADSQKLIKKMQLKTNPCIQFLQESGARFSKSNLVPKRDVFNNFLDYCINTNRKMIANVSFEVWCRDYFDKAVLEACPGYDSKLERRSSVRIKGQSKRVECFPIEFGNLPEFRGEVVAHDEAVRSYNDQQAYDEENLPDHIIERITLEAQEMQRALELTQEQMFAYKRKKLEAEGYRWNEKSQSFDKGDDIEF